MPGFCPCELGPRLSSTQLPRRRAGTVFLPPSNSAPLQRVSPPATSALADLVWSMLLVWLICDDQLPPSTPGQALVAAAAVSRRCTVSLQNDAPSGLHVVPSLAATRAQMLPAYSRGSTSTRAAFEVFSATNSGGAPMGRVPAAPRRPDTQPGRNPGDVMGRWPVISPCGPSSKATALRGRGLRRGAVVARKLQAGGGRGRGAGGGPPGPPGAAPTRVVGGCWRRSEAGAASAVGDVHAAVGENGALGYRGADERPHAPQLGKSLAVRRRDDEEHGGRLSPIVRCLERPVEEISRGLVSSYSGGRRRGVGQRRREGPALGHRARKHGRANILHAMAC